MTDRARRVVQDHARPSYPRPPTPAPVGLTGPASLSGYLSPRSVVGGRVPGIALPYPPAIPVPWAVPSPYPPADERVPEGGDM